jgi:hypothetical protein
VSRTCGNVGDTYTVEPGYNDIGLCVMSTIASDIR